MRYHIAAEFQAMAVENYFPPDCELKGSPNSNLIPNALLGISKIVSQNLLPFSFTAVIPSSENALIVLYSLLNSIYLYASFSVSIFLHLDYYYLTCPPLVHIYTQ